MDEQRVSFIQTHSLKAFSWENTFAIITQLLNSSLRPKSNLLCLGSTAVFYGIMNTVFKKNCSPQICILHEKRTIFHTNFKQFCADNANMGHKLQFLFTFCAYKLEFSVLKFTFCMHKLVFSAHKFVFCVHKSAFCCSS